MEKIEKIFSIIQEKFEIDREGLMGRKRNWEHNMARAYFVVIACRIGLSYYKVARLLKRDHSTIMHLFNTYKNYFADIDFWIETVRTTECTVPIKLKTGGETVNNFVDKPVNFL